MSINTLLLTLGVIISIWIYVKFSIYINKLLSGIFYSLGFYPADETEIQEVTAEVWEIQCDSCGQYRKPGETCCNHPRQRKE